MIILIFGQIKPILKSEFDLATFSARSRKVRFKIPAIVFHSCSSYLVCWNHLDSKKAAEFLQLDNVDVHYWSPSSISSFMLEISKKVERLGLYRKGSGTY